MPRRKTIQPNPIESTDLYEVRDETCWPIGRGQHNNFKKWKRIDEILEIVVVEYLDKEGRKIQGGGLGDYMRNATAFSEEMQLRGFAGEDGVDDSSLRKSIYPEVKRRLDAFTRAIADRNQKQPD